MKKYRDTEGAEVYATELKAPMLMNIAGSTVMGDTTSWVLYHLDAPETPIACISGADFNVSFTLSE